MKAKKILRIVLVIGFFLILLDQGTKLLVSKLFPEGRVFLVDVLEIVQVKDGYAVTGDENIRNMVLLLLVLILAIRFLFVERKTITAKNTINITLIIAGTVSLLIDRLSKGNTFDFLKIGGFPAVNLAECYVIIGWILFIVTFFKTSRQVNAMNKESQKRENEKNDKKSK